MTNSGIVAPGTSVGTLSMSGLDQNTSGRLQIELTSAASYDHLNVASSMTLAGTLEVPLTATYAPVAGTTFDIFDFASVSGSFDTLELPPLDPSLVWNTDALYTDGELRVAIVGDHNGDDFVDALDYVVWRMTEMPADGHATRSANYGEPAGSGSVGVANTTLKKRFRGRPSRLLRRSRLTPSPVISKLVDAVASWR